MITKKNEGSEIIIKNAMLTEYRKNSITKEWLMTNGFHYNRLFSDDKSEVYTYRFPVYKYERFTILECELKVILGENTVYVNVYAYKTINRYAPFYYAEYGNYDVVLKEIWRKIDKELKKFGVVKEDKNRWKQ